MSCSFLSLGLSTARSNPSQRTSPIARKINLVGQIKSKDLREIQSYNNHAYKSSEKTQIIFVDDLIINSQFIRSQQTHRKKWLFRIDLEEHRGEHCIEDQRERISHLAMDPSVYGKLLTHHWKGSKVDVEPLHGWCPLWQSAQKGLQMGSLKNRNLRWWKLCFVVPLDVFRVRRYI